MLSLLATGPQLSQVKPRQACGSCWKFCPYARQKKHFTDPAKLPLKLTGLRLHFDFSLLGIWLNWKYHSFWQENWERFSVIGVSRPVISISAGAAQGCTSVSTYLTKTALPEISLSSPFSQDLLHFLVNKYWVQKTQESQTYHRWVLNAPPWAFLCKP